MATLKSRLKLYAKLIRLDRPIGIYLLLWPTLWALWVSSNGIPQLKYLVIFTLGVIFMRSAGCAINDIADRDFDKHVERTKERPLTSGKITLKEAIIVLLTLLILSFILVLFLNAKTITLSLIAALLAMTYPFMKRFHHMPQAHLGAAFAMAILMSYTAVNNEWPSLPLWVLYLASTCWTVAYDTMYAMSDREDDKAIGLKSSAILFGNNDTFIIGILQLITLILLTVIGIILNLQTFYFLAIIIASGLAIYQQLLIKERKSNQCFQAFLNNHWFGMVIFIGIALDYWL